jgi:hypothetical protein
MAGRASRLCPACLAGSLGSAKTLAGSSGAGRRAVGGLTLVTGLGVGAGLGEGLGLGFLCALYTTFCAILPMSVSLVVNSDVLLSVFFSSVLMPSATFATRPFFSTAAVGLSYRGPVYLLSAS